MTWSIKANEVDHRVLGYILEVSSGDELNHMGMCQLSVPNGSFARIIDYKDENENSAIKGLLHVPNIQGASIETARQRILDEVGGTFDLTESTDQEIGDYMVTSTEETPSKVYWEIGLLCDKDKLPRWKIKRMEADPILPRKHFYAKEHVDDPEYLWDKVVDSYMELSPTFKDIPQGSNTLDLSGLFLTCYHLFRFTPALKGFSIGFDAESREEAYDRIAYLTCVSDFDKDPKTPITDPWDVDIPEIGEAGR